jgi:hypothetical protein
MIKGICRGMLFLVMGACTASPDAAAFDATVPDSTVESHENPPWWADDAGCDDSFKDISNVDAPYFYDLQDDEEFAQLDVKGACDDAGNSCQ